jgi:hypothetical protein
MQIEKRTLSDGSVRWRARWRQGGRYRARTFDRKGDAMNFTAELRRRSQVGTLAALDTGRITLAEYVAGTWASTYTSHFVREDTHPLCRDLRQTHPARARVALAP